MSIDWSDVCQILTRCANDMLDLWDLVLSPSPYTMPNWYKDRAKFVDDFVETEDLTEEDKEE